MNKYFYCLILLLKLLSVTAQVTELGLSDYYKNHFLVGTIYHGAILGDDNLNLNQQKEFEITKNEFNVITAENCMKPMYLIDEKGQYNFEESDAFVEFSE